MAPFSVKTVKVSFSRIAAKSLGFAYKSYPSLLVLVELSYQQEAKIRPIKIIAIALLILTD